MPGEANIKVKKSTLMAPSPYSILKFNGDGLAKTKHFWKKLEVFLGIVTSVFGPDGNK